MPSTILRSAHPDVGRRCSRRKGLAAGGGGGALLVIEAASGKG
jgi:hypothetical protein